MKPHHSNFTARTCSLPRYLREKETEQGAKKVLNSILLEGSSKQITITLTETPEVTNTISYDVPPHMWTLAWWEEAGEGETAQEKASKPEKTM